VEVVALMMVVVVVAAVMVLGGGYSRGYGDVGGGAGVAAGAAGTIKGPPVMGVCKLSELPNPSVYSPNTFRLKPTHRQSNSEYTCNAHILTTLCGKMCIGGEMRICVRGRARVLAAGSQPFIRTDKEASQFFAILSNHVEA